LGGPAWRRHPCRTHAGGFLRPGRAGFLPRPGIPRGGQGRRDRPASYLRRFKARATGIALGEPR
jgi:hypothetical protein